VDPAAHDPVARWLAYGHPALMLVAIGLVFVALRRGLELRRRRLRGERGRGARVAAHAAIAKPAVILVVVGLVGGLVSAVVVRDWAPLRSFHGWAGLLAAALFGATGFVGRQLLRGRSRAVDAHGWLGLVAFLAAAVAAVAGFVLLP
jgi:hypothetical protein